MTGSSQAKAVVSSTTTTVVCRWVTRQAYSVSPRSIVLWHLICTALQYRTRATSVFNYLSICTIRDALTGFEKIWIFFFSFFQLKFLFVKPNAFWKHQLLYSVFYNVQGVRTVHKVPGHLNIMWPRYISSPLTGRHVSQGCRRNLF